MIARRSTHVNNTVLFSKLPLILRGGYADRTVLFADCGNFIAA
jgi:hypothetical protein